LFVLWTMAGGAFPAARMYVCASIRGLVGLSTVCGGGTPAGPSRVMGCLGSAGGSGRSMIAPNCEQ
jgi:hypothetical protein